MKISVLPGVQGPVAAAVAAAVTAESEGIDVDVVSLLLF